VKFEGKQKVEPGIPLSSLPDIVFLLLIFFMVSSVFKEFSGIPVVLPSAQKIEKLKGKRDVAYMWVSRKGDIFLDDRPVSTGQVSSIMLGKARDPQHPLKLVSLRIDKGAEMDVVSRVHEALRESDAPGALNLNYSAKLE